VSCPLGLPFHVPGEDPHLASALPLPVDLGFNQVIGTKPQRLFRLSSPTA